MIFLKQLKQMLSGFPDDAILTIDGNENGGDIVSASIKWEVGDPHAVVNLKLADGWSVTKDSVVDGLFQLLDRSRDC